MTTIGKTKGVRLNVDSASEILFQARLHLKVDKTKTVTLRKTRTILGKRLDLGSDNLSCTMTSREKKLARLNHVPGEISVIIVPEVFPPLLGYTIAKGCSGNPDPIIFMSTAKAFRPNTLAHEIGHALGLDHVKDENNLMADSVEGGWAPTGTALTEQQKDVLYLSEYAK